MSPQPVRSPVSPTPPQLWKGTKMKTSGMTFARFAKSLALAKGVPHAALAFAEAQGHWLDQSQVVRSIKGVIGATTTADMELPTPASVDFAEYLRPLTIIGKLENLRRV